MRAFLVIVLVACVGLLLQSTFFHDVGLGRIVPDVLLVLCVYLGLNQHSIAGASGAFLLGYLQDAASASPAGLSSCGMLVVFVLVYLTCRRLWVDNVVSKVVLVFLASLVKAAVVFALLLIFLPGGFDRSGGIGSVMLQSAVSASIAPAVFWLLATTGIRSNREAE